MTTNMPFTFLICSERSGSNLITRMMNNHSETCGPTPSHVFRAFGNNRLRYGDLYIDDNWQQLLQDITDYLNNQLGEWQTSWTADHLQNSVQDRTLAAIIRSVYEEEARAYGKSRLFIKENQTFRLVPYLLASFPAARFLYQVRDPRDVVLSWKKSPSNPGGVYDGVEIWKRDQTRSIEIFGYLKDTGRITLLRYEDLIMDPEAQLNRVCRFMEMSYEPEMLRYYEDDITVRNAERIQGWQNLQKPLMKENTGKYRQELTQLETRYIEAACQDEMRALGYQPDYPPGDLTALENELVTLEKTLPPRSDPMTEEEAAIRANRLSIIERIIHRPIDSIVDDNPS